MRSGTALAILVGLLALVLVLAPPTARAGSRAAQSVGVPGDLAVRGSEARGDLPQSVYRWHLMVHKYWQRWSLRILHRRITNAEVHKALWIIYRESRGDPRAVNRYSGCAGLFQLLPGYSRGKYNLLDPRTNCSLAAQLYVRRGWAPWRATAW